MAVKERNHPPNSKKELFLHRGQSDEAGKLHAMRSMLPRTVGTTVQINYI